MGVLRTIIGAWAAAGDQPNERAIILRLPADLLNAVETLAFVSNERRKAMGSSQGGSDNWAMVTREELIEEAVAEYIRQHLRVETARGPTRAKYPDSGSGRVQRRT
jgi:hypothetical protein